MTAAVEPVAALVAALAGARKAVQLYPPSHPHHIDAIDSLVRTASEAAAAGQGAVTLYQGRLYSGTEVLPHELPGVDGLSQAMEARKVESLTFEAAFGPSDATGLLGVLGLRPSPELDVKAELETRGVGGVHVAFIVDEQAEEREERDRRREEMRALYQQVIMAMKAIRQHLIHSKQANLDQAGSLAQTVVSRLLDDKASVMGLATLSSAGEGGLFHAVNVMIYAVALGATLGLPQEGLEGLAISALLHDIGKVRFNPQDPEQLEVMRLAHPEEGAEILSRLMETDPSPMLVAYEHHMAPDGGGWPPPKEEGYVPHPYSRMVAIANAYEHMTKGDPGVPAMTPDAAVAQILIESGPVYDPLFTRVFAKAMGVFPIGCAVRLSDHSVGVVCDTGDDPLRPTVRLLFDADGSPLDPPEEADLAVDEREIVEVLDPSVVKLEVSEHL
jgi:putative nucleotidyltransferase with HDIG domain